MNGRPRPVVIMAALVALVVSVVDFLVIADVWKASESAVAAFHLVVGNAGAAIGVFFVQRQVTPNSDPRDSDGHELVAVAVS